MKKKIVMSLLMVAAYSASIAQTPSPGVVISNKTGWHKIADRHASFKADRDEVMVLGNDRFRQIKLKVKDASLNLTSYEVYFENDSKQSIMVNKILKPGEETTPANVDNGYSIKKITLNYNTVGSTTKVKVEKDGDIEVDREKERAEVEIWGLK